MSTIDIQMKQLYQNILDNGYLRKPSNQFYADGTPARRKSIFGGTIRIEPEDGLAFVTSKRLPPKSLSAEVLGFYQHYTNKVSDLQALGTRVWDEWEGKGDGTIGKSYGWQIANKTYFIPDVKVSRKVLDILGLFIKEDALPVYANASKYDFTKKGWNLNQMEYVIWQIIDQPESTRILTNLWSIPEIDEMALPPCVFFTQWVVMGDTLHLLIKPRSSDAFLGLPFNCAQFHVLQHLVAHVTNKKAGTFEVQMTDVHLYDRHFDSAIDFINRKEHASPSIWIDPSVKKWGDFKYKDNFEIINYENEGTIKAEITVNTEELKEKGLI